MTIEQEQLQKRLAALITVQDVAQDLMSELDHIRLLNKVLSSAIKVLNASAGSLLLWLPPNELEFAVSAEQSLVGQRMPADKGIAGWVFTHEEPLIVGNVYEDERFFQEVDPGFQTRSLIAVPLMTPTERIGVIEVINKQPGEQFTEQDRDILTALSAQAATAIVNARLYQELQEEKDRIIATENEIHKKLARDLHDGPAQTLAAMIMDVDIVLKLYERDPARVPEELERLRQAASKTLAQVRNTMFELRPVILETQGLVPALESYVERLVSTEGMVIHLDIRSLPERLPSKIEGLCFSIIQEALSNVKKHAHAENTWIIVERRTKDLIVAVRDDGQGFDVTLVQEGYDSRGSLGLLNMRERSEMLGARYSIDSKPGHGTLVSLIVPLEVETKPESQEASQGEQQGSPNGGRRPGTGPLGQAQTPAGSGRKISRRRKGTGPLNLLNHGKQADDSSTRT